MYFIYSPLVPLMHILPKMFLCCVVAVSEILLVLLTLVFCLLVCRRGGRKESGCRGVGIAKASSQCVERCKVGVIEAHGRNQTYRTSLNNSAHISNRT